jgi:hypothetical protein
MHLSILVSSVLLVGSVVCHPGHDHQAEQTARQEALRSYATRNLDHCADKIAAWGLEARNIKRRQELATKLRQARNIPDAVLGEP